MALQGGKVIWKERLPAETYTPPLVAGRRVFAQTADRSTTAFDGQSGRRLWTQTRAAGDALVLRWEATVPPRGTVVADWSLALDDPALVVTAARPSRAVPALHTTP